jgi:TolB-like protein
MKRLTVALMMLMGSAVYAAGPAKVLLLPFDSVGPGEKQWIAKALQQNLLAELSRINSVEPVAGDRSAANLDAAVKAAQDAGAEFVVFGSYQSIEGDLRMTGQVVDISKKQAVAGLKSTGSQRDLFGMEDVIASQIKRALPQPVAEARPEMLKQPPAAPPAPAPNDLNGPLVMNDALRAQQLEEQIDRAIDRLRYSSSYADTYYPPNYFYSGFYYPRIYPIFVPVRNRFHHHPWSGSWGSFHSGNFSGNFTAGGTVSDGRNYNVPVGNYASFGRMSIQPVNGGTVRR